MVYDYTAMIIILVLDFFAYKKEKYWTKLFSNVQQRLSYSSSNSWLLQMSCTTILSVSTMKPKPLWILICILNTISPEKFKNVMVRLLGIWNNYDARVYSFNTSTKFCPLLTTTNLWVDIFTLKVDKKGPYGPSHCVDIVFGLDNYFDPIIWRVWSRSCFRKREGVIKWPIVHDELCAMQR